MLSVLMLLPMWLRYFVFAFALISWSLSASGEIQISPLNVPELGKRWEFRLQALPGVSNPFDPDVIRVDGTFTSPSGKKLTVPAFWFQQYQRSGGSGSEVLSSVGAPEWRLRFVPDESGQFRLSVQVLTNGQPCVSGETVFPVEGPPPARRGYVRLQPARQYFETGDGLPLPLVGENVGWHGSRGTYDYDDWFTALSAAKGNYARLWMCPWAFGIEVSPMSLTRYNLSHAWQLDYVLQLAESKGIYLLLCLDYHGMFETEPDYWGGNNYWSTNPYNIANGGPCVNQNAFFTNATAKTLYQKRLRYLIGRYGYSPNLLAWQFFNEIDNVYSHLNPPDVAAWHGELASWLHSHDPFGHLVTTSLTGGSDRPEIWSLPGMDFANYHSYGEAAPAGRLASVTADFRHRYGKPVLIDEFGTDWRGWNRAGDPFLRGLRQGIWGGALGGSVGTSMPWFWEHIHSEDAYPAFTACRDVLKPTGWGAGLWTNVQFVTSGSPPGLVGEAVDGAAFDTLLVPGTAWGAKPSGQLAVPSPRAEGYAAQFLNAFVHGSSHSDLRVPFRLSAWLTNNARVVLHLNSVSQGAIMVVRVNGSELFRTNLPNLDGGWSVNNEYDLDVPVNLPGGKSLIEIANAGADWFYLDWVRLERVQPAAWWGGWQPSPEAIGLSNGKEALLYVVAPGTAFPAMATNSPLPLQENQELVLTNWVDGDYSVTWRDPATGLKVGSSQAVATGRTLRLRLPAFREDLAGILLARPSLTSLGLDEARDFRFRLDSEIGGRYALEQSNDLIHWSDGMTLTNDTGQAILGDSGAHSNSARFWRARRL